MMELLVVSDTHGRSDRLEEVLRRTGTDTLLFLGDGLRDLDVIDEARVTVRAVRGNCDWFSAAAAPQLRLEIFGAYRILMMHGHTAGVKASLAVAIDTALDNEADVLLYGHTHEPFEKMLLPDTVLENGRVLKKPLLIVCPGSLGEPRRGAPTFATLTIRANGILAGFGQL